MHARLLPIYLKGHFILQNICLKRSGVCPDLLKLVIVDPQGLDSLNKLYFLKNIQKYKTTLKIIDFMLTFTMRRFNVNKK